MRKKKAYDSDKEIKAIARERVGVVKPSRTIMPEKLRDKPKHKKPAGSDDCES